jgi:hypothetical protein
MVMRSAALALVLSLTAPAAMRLICELSCLQALHHSSAPAHECHEQPAGDTARQTASAAAVLCHDESGTPPSTAVAAKALLLLEPTAPVVFASVDRPAARPLPPGTQARPPDPLRLTTQLRI